MLIDSSWSSAADVEAEAAADDADDDSHGSHGGPEGEPDGALAPLVATLSSPAAGEAAAGEAAAGEAAAGKAGGDGDGVLGAGSFAGTIARLVRIPNLIVPTGTGLDDAALRMRPLPKSRFLPEK